MPRRRARFAALALVVLSACSSGGGAAAPTTTTAPPTTTTTTAPSTTTTTAPPTTTTAGLVPGITPVWAAVPTSGPVKAIVTSTGVVLPVSGAAADGKYRVDTPCSNHAVVGGAPYYGANVVLDPGHGGDELGAVGKGGLTEKAVNLAVAEDTATLLRAAGAEVVLTRTSDYRITLATRGEIATNLHPQVFVSIHHNAEPDGPFPRPGNETYYQVASADSKRLAGLVYEEIQKAFSAYQIAWMADRDAGAKYRTTSSGGNYYGILHRTEGVPGVLSEAAYISNPPEEQLLATDAFRQVEATAIARAVVRYLNTADPGSGYVTPYPRTEPAGSGGGPTGCVDPPLG
ncbi:MAG TPA: N-acetylmuramoyl-L-alanine amidase [Acidimicrobiales bacterium]